MERFYLYAGLSGGFGGARYCQSVEAENIDEAYQAAYELAVEEYQSYEGCHGIMNWGDCYEDAVESGFIDEKSMTEDEIHEYVDDMYQNEIESWIEYYALPANDYNNQDEDAD